METYTISPTLHSCLATNKQILLKDEIKQIKLRIEADVKKNDILVTFYDRDLGTDFVIVQSEDWLKALNNAKEADQKRKEEWAAKQKENKPMTLDCGDACCESC